MMNPDIDNIASTTEGDLQKILCVMIVNLYIHFKKINVKNKQFILLGIIMANQ